MAAWLFLLLTFHILGLNLPSFSAELVSSNYQVGNLQLQRFPSKNDSGGFGAFSTIALASPENQPSLPKIHDINFVEKVESCLTAIWQAVTVDKGGDSVTAFIGEISEFDTPAFCLTDDFFRFASRNIADQACNCILSICFLMEIGIISTIFLCGLCGMHRRIPRRKRRRLPFYLVKKCRNRRFKTINELKAVIQNGVDSGRVKSNLNRKSMSKSCRKSKSNLKSKSKSNRKSKSKSNRKSMSKSYRKSMPKLYRKSMSNLYRKSKSNRKLKLCLSASECFTISNFLLSLRTLV